MKRSFVLAILLTSILLIGSSCTRTVPNNVSENGRFTIITSPHVQKATFLLDTKTGKTWNLQVDKDDYYVWADVNYEEYDDNGEYIGMSRNAIPVKDTP